MRAIAVLLVSICVLSSSAYLPLVARPLPVASMVAGSAPASFYHAFGVDVGLRHHHFGGVDAGEAFRVPVVLLLPQQRGDIRLTLSLSEGLLFSGGNHHEHEFALPEGQAPLFYLPVDVDVHAMREGRHYIHLLVTSLLPSGQQMHRSLSVKVDVSSSSVLSVSAFSLKGALGSGPAAQIGADGRVIRAFSADESIY